MYAIFTAAFISVLALVSSLAVVVQAEGPEPVCASLYQVKKAGIETCLSIAQKEKVTVLELMSMNFEINCDATLPAGTLCIGMKTPLCKSWAITADTTCQALLSTNHLSLQQFLDLNDNVNSDCTNLVKGSSYCVAD